MKGITDPTPQWFEKALLVPRDDNVVEVEGCPIHYFRWGDPQKAGVVMVHGFLAHARCFAFVAPLLANDFHVTALDLSGMGDSGRRSSYETATRARELMALLRHLGMTEHETKPFIVSHSYGGTIGLEAMEHHGADLGGLVICDMMVMRPKLLDAYYSTMQEHRRARPPTLYPDLATAMGRYRLMPPQICANRYLMQYMAYHSLREETEGWAWKFDPLILEGDARDQTWWGGAFSTDRLSCGEKSDPSWARESPF